MPYKDKSAKAINAAIYRVNNSNKLRELKRKWKKNNKEKVRRDNYKRRIRRSHELREEALMVYGGKCECCGINGLAFLCFDHINGGGTVHRLSFGCNGAVKFLRWLLCEMRTDIRVLCWNCNWATHRYGVCPHAS